MSFGTQENLVNGAPRKLGGKQVGPLAFGCWRLVGDNVADATQRIETALDNGLTLIDNADVYGLDWGGQAFGESEMLLGKVLAADKTLRDRMMLASKGGIIPGIPYVAGADYLNAAVDASLTRLQTDHIDLYQIHRPDMFAHPAETAAALDGLVQAGKIGMVGISNYTQAQEDALRQFLKAPLVSLQSEYSLAALTMLRDGSLDRCMTNDTAFLAWSPLAGGKLISGDNMQSELMAKIDKLAARENTDRAGIALAFVLAHPAAPIAIIGAQNLDRIKAVTQALSVCLTRQDVYALIEASEGLPLP
ncbi:MAG: Oxidoreductase YdhF [Alphaproteobacteria bacterium]|nr:MAG: Oxidoreductase YdhF [Alphaproteobacteria bacterium]